MPSPDRASSQTPATTTTPHSSPRESLPCPRSTVEHLKKSGLPHPAPALPVTGHLDSAPSQKAAASQTAPSPDQAARLPFEPTPQAKDPQPRMSLPQTQSL